MQKEQMHKNKLFRVIFLYTPAVLVIDMAVFSPGPK
jgi:hypothetical protein